jgi:hypothetical protein
MATSLNTPYNMSTNNSTRLQQPQPQWVQPMAGYKLVQLKPEEIDQFQRNVFRDSETLAPAETNNKKKPFNFLKWAAISTVGTVVGVPLLAAGAFSAWFLHNPSSLSKTMKPENITAMAKKFANGEQVEIPKGIRIANPPKDKSNFWKGMNIAGNYADALRSLPADNKKQILKYVLSFKGIKDGLEVPKLITNIMSGNMEEATKRNLDFVSNIMAKGGTVTKKYGQTMADGTKNSTLRYHGRLVQLEKAGKKGTEEYTKTLNDFETSRRFYQSLSKLQSQEVHLTKAQTKHYQTLFDNAVAEYNIQNPSSKLSTKALSELKKIEASTAVVVLHEGKAFKLPRPDALPKNAVDNLQLLTSLNASTQNLLSIESKKDPDKNSILKAAVESANGILEGANFDNEIKGLTAIRDVQTNMGVKQGLAPKGYFSAQLKGADGEHYSVAVMDQIHSEGDLSGVILKAVLAPDTLNSKSPVWDAYHRFMHNDAFATVAMQNAPVRSADLHSGNLMLKSKEIQDAIHASGEVNGGAIPIDVAEYIALPKSVSKSIANITLTALNGNQGLSSGRAINNQAIVTSINEFLGSNAGKVSEETKQRVAKDIAYAPLRALGMLYKEPEIAQHLSFPEGVGLNAKNVERAEQKFLPLLSDIRNYVQNHMTDASSPEYQRMMLSKKRAAQQVLTQLEGDSGKTYSDAEKETLLKAIEERFLNRTY